MRGGFKIFITHGVTALDWTAIFYFQRFQDFQVRLCPSSHCGTTI